MQINDVIKLFRNLYPHDLSANQQYHLADTHPAYFRIEYNTVDWRHTADYRLAVSPHDQQQTDNLFILCLLIPKHLNELPTGRMVN